VLISARKQISISSNSSKSGFTILEVLIALLLVGVGVFAIMETFNRGVFGFGEVDNNYSLALSLSQEKLEEIKDSAFSAVASQSRIAVSGYTSFDQQVAVTSPHADLKQVAVTTYWQVPGGENNISLTTYVVNNL